MTHIPPPTPREPLVKNGQISLFWMNFFQTMASVVEHITLGEGSPEGLVTADPGHLYLNHEGGAGATLWVKESGTGNTGWVAK